MIPMVCPAEDDLLSLVTDEVGAVELQEHLDRCQACRERLARLRAEMRSLRRSFANSESGKSFVLEGSTTKPTETGSWSKPDPGAETVSGSHSFPPGDAPTVRRVPASIGKYLVVGQLDGGGQADVYRVVHPGLAKELILKWARKPSFGRERESNRLVGEGKVLASLTHPGLVPVVDLDFAENRPFLVMEYVRGCHLQQTFFEHRPTVRQAVEWVAQIARAVALAHRLGVVHQDIKPKNILIDETGRARLIDFGMARWRDAYSGDLDQPGGGTLAYIAPEPLRSQGREASARSDVFSLGGVLYFLLTGKAPYEACDRDELWDRALRADFDREPLKRQGVRGRLERIVLRAMAAEPADRFGSADDLADQLEAFAVRSRRIALAAGLVAGVGIVAASAWWLSSTPKPRSAAVLLEPHSILRVRRGDEIFDNLCDCKGVVTDDRIRIRADVPPGLIPAFFWLDAEGKLEKLEPVEVAPHDQGERWIYPKNGMDSRLNGSIGTEMVLVCGLKSDAIGLEEVAKELGGSKPLPGLLPGVTLLLDRNEVKEHAERGGRGPETPEPSSMGDALARMEKLRLGLRDRCPYLAAAAFTHRPPEPVAPFRTEP